MQTISDSISFLVGDYKILDEMQSVPVLPTFSDSALEFLEDLSRELLSDKSARKYIDVVSYAYWIRKASLEREKEKHFDYINRIGRGIAFHVAPSNVPINFAVSMTSSVIAGNSTVIRLSNKQFEQVDIICKAINKLLESTHSNLRPYFCIVRYDYSNEITDWLSSICDVRIIWGGDRTIEDIRKSPIQPRTIEMAFSDRYSVAIINAESYLAGDSDRYAHAFYTDTYYTDQNACSSPRIVVWTGNNVAEARELFWQKLDDIVTNEYDMKPIQAVDKYTSMCMLGMKGDFCRLVSKNNYIIRVEVSKLSESIMDYKNGGGYFFEYITNDLDELVPMFTKRCQTVSVLGVEKSKIKKIVFENGVRGVDRIVELGHTMDLEFIWDGYMMIENMSRVVYVGNVNEKI